MIELIQNMKTDQKTYIVSCGGWQSISSGISAEDASTKSIEEMVKIQGDKLPVSPVIETVCLSDIEEDLELEQYREFIYCPKVLANAGFHETAKNFSKLIDEKTKSS